MIQQTIQLHENDREEHAKRLGLSLSEFDRLVASANEAHRILKDLGPFYGKEEVREPTFRITAEPVLLPRGSYALLQKLGEDLLFFGKALQHLPENVKETLGLHLDYSIPPTWRIDAIVTKDGSIKVNEIEGVDGANALMMGEQFAYHLQELSESTAAKIIPTLKEMCSESTVDGNCKIAVIKNNIEFDTTIPNARRFIHFLQIISRGSIHLDLFDGQQLQSGQVMPDWNSYGGVINESFLSPQELYHMGVQKRQLIASGNYNALGNKGAFALLFDKSLDAFWMKEIGQDRMERLRNILIPSQFIYTEKEIEAARKAGKVVKVSWAGTNTLLINRSRGVAMPHGEIEQGTDERWKALKEFFQQGVRVIAQDFVEPARIPAFLRKRGTTLEKAEWYNRVCVKYVASSNPNSDILPEVFLTATEVTLGPNVIPAGRECAFSAGVLT